MPMLCFYLVFQVCRNLAAADISISVAQTLSFVTTSNSCLFAPCGGQFITEVKIFRDTGLTLMLYWASRRG